jgi:uncharacterized protein YegL
MSKRKISKTNKDYTHISIIMDRSGSMNSIALDMEGGLKEFIENQKKLDGKATITFSQFDHEYVMVNDFEDIQNVKAISLKPRGMTALLDAMGKNIIYVRDKIKSKARKDRPHKCVFVIITDGLENASREFKKDSVFEIISSLKNENSKGEQQDKYGVFWDFVFLGANQNAIQEGSSFGISSNSALDYEASSDGAKRMFVSLSDSMKQYRYSKEYTSYSFK